MRNRLLIALMLAIITGAPSQADEISPEMARIVAEAFLRNGGVASTKAAGDLVLLNADALTRTKSSSRVPYYIFNMGDEAFVIISAVDAARPVLGYSFDNAFSLGGDMPDNIKSWLAMYGSQIDGWRSSGQEATAEQKAGWTEVLYPKMTGLNLASADLKTAHWGQTAPCNNFCPVAGNGQRTIVGCVATAISELMYYYKYPECGNGVLPSYVTSYGLTVPSITLGEKYAWDDMLPSYAGGRYSDSQANAVATLMYHNAVMSKAEFGTGSTGAVLPNAVTGMMTYMGYGKAAYQHSKDFKTDLQWKSMLKAELDASRPVLYSGMNSVSGGYHAFLVDGYDSDNRFKINFGWFGQNNGYYELGAFGLYSLDETAFINLYPDKEGTTDYENHIRFYNDEEHQYRGLMLADGCIEPGNTVYMNAGPLLNVGFKKFDGFFNLALTGYDGTVKAWFLNDGAVIELESGYGLTFAGLAFQIPSRVKIEPGDAIRAFYRAKGEKEWKEVDYGENPECKVNGTIPCHISDFTSLSYSGDSRSFTVKTYRGVTYEVISSSLMPVYKGAADVSGSFNVNMSALEPGDWYIMNMTYGNQSLSVKLK